MGTHQKHLYEFGPFQLDPDEGLLLRDGGPVTMTRKTFEILLLLVEHHGKVVRKGDFLGKVWADTFVHESSLTVNISVLRKALGEGQNGQKYIETVPGRGYRFIAPVRQFEDETSKLVVEDNSNTQTTNKAQGQTYAPLKVAQEEARQLYTIRSQRIAWRLLIIIVIPVVLLLLMASFLLISNNAIHNDQSTAAKNDATLRIKSLAVLPFESINQNEDDYLRMGLTDALITRLGSLNQITVRPLSAVRRFSEGAPDPVIVGRELNVDSVLTGSIQVIGNRMRVTARLIAVPEGQQLWGDIFDLKLSDIFRLQDSISQQLANALAIKLTGEESRLLTKHNTESPEAYEAFMRGRYFLSKRTEEATKKAIDYFQEAIRLDTEYAEAYAGVADSYILYGLFNWMPVSSSFPQGRSYAIKALGLDNTLAEAYVALGFIGMFYDWNWAEAEKNFKRAIEINPNYVTSHHWFAYVLTFLERFEEALTEIRRAREIDPFSVVINADEAAILCYARRYDEAIERGQKALEMDTNLAHTHSHLGWAYEQKQMYDEAIAFLQRAYDLDPIPLRLAQLGRAYAAAGEKEKSVNILLQLEELSKKTYVPAYYVAELCATLGDEDRAFAFLERAYKERDPGMMALKVRPGFNNLRSSPRYKDLLRRIGLPD
jgi:DNA-binding winged helix-turn-helix (wHTH) protein/TolB-like protein/Tfp pilus assembly protein PilF